MASLSVWLKGESLPEIQRQSLFHDNDEVRFRWSPPSVVIPNVTYGIYYGVTLDELFESMFNYFNNNFLYLMSMLLF